MNRTLRHHWLTIAAVVIVLIAALPVITYPFWRDHGAYANIAMNMLGGGTPYLDMWDVKPPAIYYLYAAAIQLFGATTQAIRSLDLWLLPFALFAVAFIAHRLRDRITGALAALLLGVFYFTETFASITQSDSLSLVPASLAAAAAFIAARAPAGSRRALIAGLVCGIMSGALLWFKPHYALIVMSFIVYLLVERRTFPLKEAAAFVAGGLIGGGFPLLVFATNGMLEQMLLISQGAATYGSQWREFFASLGHYFMFRWWHWGPLIVLAVLWLPLNAIDRQNRGGWWLIFLWLSGGLLFMLSQAKGFDTHWLPMLPPLAIIAADALVRLSRRISSTRSPALLTLAGIFFLGILISSTWARALPYLTGAEDQQTYYRRFTGGDVNAGDSLQMAQWLRERVLPGDTIYIWGYRTEVIFMANLRPATRFQMNTPLIIEGYPDAWRAENVDVLRAAMPPYAIVMQNDYRPWELGTDKDAHELLVEYEDLSNWYSEYYERVEQIGNFLIWQRKPS